MDIINIGSSVSNTKNIQLDKYYSKDSIIVIDETIHSDEFEINMINNNAIFKRIDSKSGWSHNHTAKIYYLFDNISQVAQDKFVINILKNKKNGYFLEIGSGNPIEINNTFVLEKFYNWKGIMIDYYEGWAKYYKKIRQNSIFIINDAVNIDYAKLLLDNNFPYNIDYLQIDLEVNNGSTINVLELLNKTVFKKYKFAVITFEHDVYTGDYYNTRERSRDIFNINGYILVFGDVMHDTKKFEDWYIYPELVDMNYINKIKTAKSINQFDVMKILNENIE